MTSDVLTCVGPAERRRDSARNGKEKIKSELISSYMHPAMWNV
jgi:hypothetical protein